MKPSNNRTAGNALLPAQLRRVAIAVLVLVLVADQASKFWVKTNMYLDQSIPVLGNWFYIHFIENAGMAFGFEFGGSTGKLLLSIFRIVAVAFIGVYLTGLIKSGARKGLVIAVSLVLAGAVGNIIDSAFYGLIFSESPRFSPQIAVLFPPEGGYASFLQGKVVDMLYFPIINTTWPAWMPWVGGEPFQFFRPVFNLADSAITVGMSMIILFQKRYFSAAQTTETSGSEKLQGEHDGK